ncbi:hypothetical protein Sste5346_001878 [Sporothrix stenoceras]|uniref:Uncharacterized protein n=1 Tax=Sporothrix stenoceras TaxID=5173 RepID=A0ABR3ZLD1_9PEZI
MAPAKGRKRAYSNVSVEDSELDGFGQDDAGSVQKPAQGKKTRGTDCTSDRAGTRNQEADRVRQYVTTFEKDIVAAGRDKALAALNRGKEAKAKQDKKNLERIREAYDTASVGASLGVADHPLYAAGREVLELFYATIARYEEANKALEEALNFKGEEGDTQQTKSVDAVQASWKQDRAEAQKLLQYGRVYGDSLVHEIIVPKAAGTPMGGPVGEGKGNKETVAGIATPERGLNQTGRSALEMFPRSRATVAGGKTWGEAAKSQVLALKGLLKTLPDGGGYGNVYEETSARKSVTFNC